MDNILYFKPRPPMEDEILFDFTIHPKSRRSDNYFCIFYRKHGIHCHIGITATSFDNAKITKTIALQKLRDEFDTLLQEGELTYYM
ncbi:MAG: hypothetical protein IJ252_05005 [Solobacterium sp.]|nr:hypothetical protein [Solobacterium sp.]